MLVDKDIKNSYYNFISDIQETRGKNENFQRDMEGIRKGANKTLSMENHNVQDEKYSGWGYHQVRHCKRKY